MAALSFWPLPSYQGRPPVISSGYGPRGKPPKQHRGVDIDYRAIASDPPYTGRYTADRTPHFFGPAGVPVLAADTGRVIKSRRTSGGGEVVIAHPPPSYDPKRQMVTIYRHLAARYVKVGQGVDAGQRLGTMGASTSTPFRHLHFAVKVNGKYADPGPMLARKGVEVLTPADSLQPTKWDAKTKPVRKAGGPWLIVILLLLAKSKSR